CPEVSSPPRVPDVEPTPEPGEPAPAPAAPPSHGAIRPAEAFPIPSNCEAPLAITQEVTRLLTAAAAHGTRSSACVDGPGARLAINDVLVCPAAPQGGDVVVKVFYQVVTYPEGDTRGCGQGRDCSWLTPTASEQLVELRLRKGKDPARGTLVDPGPLPGFPEDATPLGEAHDGNCYGKSPAFVPAEISLSR
ncbi:MAG: hypothetical protein KC501_29565, partial [Myxococcales bacterium]|nr:hypothetical protein [Myxococcales bacterium]